MKTHQKILLGLLLLCTRLYADPLLVCVLMVKNEASVIIPTVQPMVDAGIKDFVIFDTGSTDGTQKIIKDFFDTHPSLCAYVLEEAFIDFATSRNHALEATQKLFPDAIFMLMPDAEWYLHDGKALLKFCEQHRSDAQLSYLVSIKNDTIAFYVARLIRCGRNVAFAGAVHEALTNVATVRIPDNVYFEWAASRAGQKKSAERWKRDKDLLLKSLEQDPLNPRTFFYLAQTCDCLGDIEQAFERYHQRAILPGWDEETFVTWLRLGDITLRVSQDSPAYKKHAGTEICPLPVQCYLKAFSLRPHRAEPLVKLAEYYIDKNNMALAYVFAKRAVQIPYPTHDILFVARDLYDFTRYDLLGRCAWYIGEYETGEWAVRQALKVKPDAQYLHRNLKFYTDRKATQNITQTRVSRWRDSVAHIIKNFYQNMLRKLEIGHRRDNPMDIAFLATMTEKLKAGQNIIFTKFGDGEYFCITGVNGRNCDHDSYHPWLGEELKKSFLSLIKKPNAYLGKWWTADVYTYFDNLAQQNSAKVPWVYFDLFVNNELNQQFNYLKNFVDFIIHTHRKKILICNRAMTRLKDFFKADVCIEVPSQDWTFEYARWKDIVEQHVEKDCILLSAGGMGCKLLANDLTNAHDMTHIDFGSAFDMLGAKKKTRVNQVFYEDNLRYYKDLLPKNWI